MSERSQIFRQVSLERLSSPERLDALMQVVTLRAWMAWVPLAALMLAALLWGIYGSVSTVVSGRAILLQSAGLAEVSASAPGRVSEVLVGVGNRVSKGAPVARVSQPELDERRRQAEERLGELRRQEERLRQLIARGAQLSEATLAQERATLEQRLKAAEERMRLLGERESVQARLLEQGLITRQSLLETRAQQNAARLEAETLRGDLKQLALRRLEEQRRGEAEQRQIQAQIGEARRTLEGLEQSERLTTVVESPHTGRVVEIKVARGMLVSPGMSLMTIEPDADAGAGLEAAIFLAPADGKKVRPGMRANVAPSTVRREEFGYVIGEITFVSDYPASAQSMRLTLQNENLVRELSGAAPPIEVRARLLRSERDGGYRWSSPAGDGVTLTAGTLAAAEIEVRRQAPITLVIPALRQALGIR